MNLKQFASSQDFALGFYISELIEAPDLDAVSFVKQFSDHFSKNQYGAWSLTLEVPNRTDKIVIDFRSAIVEFGGHLSCFETNQQALLEAIDAHFA